MKIACPRPLAANPRQGGVLPFLRQAQQIFNKFNPFTFALYSTYVNCAKLQFCASARLGILYTMRQRKNDDIRTKISYLSDSIIMM